MLWPKADIRYTTALWEGRDGIEYISTIQHVQGS